MKQYADIQENDAVQDAVSSVSRRLPARTRTTDILPSAHSLAPLAASVTAHVQPYGGADVLARSATAFSVVVGG